MSSMILCRGKVAKIPLYISQSDSRLYTEEELCYYIYNNIYLITNDFVSDELVKFLGEQVGDAALAQRIMHLKQNNASLATVLVTILKSVNYYSFEEIEDISDILNTLASQNVYERLGYRADAFLERNSYYKALDCYNQLLKEYRNEMSGAYLAKVYHNAGVAYARMFLYKEAAESFKNAYEIGQHKEFYDYMLAAEYLAEKSKPVVNEDISRDELVVRKKIEMLLDNAQQNINVPMDNAEDILSHWKQDYYKYTAR